MLCEPRNGFSHLAIRSELNRTQEIARRTKEKDNSLIQKGDCYTYLEKIASLEDAIVDTSNKVNHRALLLKDSLDSSLKLGSSIEKCWAWLSQISQMAQLHLKNASTFHVFHAQCKELKVAIDTPGPSHSKFLAQRSLRANLFEIDRKNALLRDRLAHYMHLCQQSESLISSCNAVVPIHLRTERVCQPTKAILLCNLETLEAKAEANEAVLLLDNADQANWAVQLRNGKQLKVPSVALLVPGPDTSAIETAFSLRDKLYVKWKDELDMAQSLIIDLLQSFINDIVEGRVWVDNACLEGLLQTLTEVELDLTFDMEDAGGTDFMRQLQKCRQILEQPEGLPRQRSGADNLTQDNVRAISNLVRSFKEHVKNCRQLKKHLRRKRPPSIPDMPTSTSSHLSDVDKLMQRLSDASDSSSIFTDPPDDASSPGTSPTCVSRMHFHVNAAPPPPTERFVDTKEIPRRMGITVQEEKERFRSVKRLQLKERQELGEFSVKLFHVANVAAGESVAVQTEEEEDFDCGDVITAKRARGQHASAPPPRTTFGESWTQTDPKQVRENLVVFAKEAASTGAQTDAPRASNKNSAMQTDPRQVQETQVIFTKSCDNSSAQTQPQPRGTAGCQTDAPLAAKVANSWSQTSVPGTFETKTQTDSPGARSYASQTDPPKVTETQVIFNKPSEESSAQTQALSIDSTSCQTEAALKTPMAHSWSQTGAPCVFDAKTQTNASGARSFASQTERKRVEDAQVLFRTESSDVAIQTPRPLVQETSVGTPLPNLQASGFQTAPQPRREGDSSAQTDPMVLEVVSRVQVCGQGSRGKVVTWDLVPEY